ncbi:MAG: glycosyl hydrolase family 18 protein [Eubacteriales bacterium]|nr:glycosyl hydrolase family 18 protein [Eubacteriales bacterium]
MRKGLLQKRKKWSGARTKVAWLLLMTLFVILTLPTETVASKAPKKNKNFRVIGYFPSWKPGEVEKVRFDVLTHVIYAFAIPTARGGLMPLENPGTAQELIWEAHRSGKKVLLAVGGWSYNGTPLENTFVSATATASKRKGLVKSIMRTVQKYGFDGVDMDWEHPRKDTSSEKQYEELMLLLAKKLHRQGKILTSAVLSGATPDGGIYYDAAAHTDRVLGAVDWIHVMAYDGGDGKRHSSVAFAKASARYWRKTRKLAAKKVVLGVPFYARPGWVSYGELVNSNPKAKSKSHVTYRGMDVWYNGVPDIKKKTKYAMKNLGGIMIWEVTQDSVQPAKSLQTAIKKMIR